MFEGHPKGLWALALANTGERFGYYTMLAVFFLFLQHNFGFSVGVASSIQAAFLGVVYFVPLFGGILADKFGFGRMVTIGILVMFLGYLCLSLPLGGGGIALVVMAAALLMICVGTGLFKGNLQVLVGNLYDEPKYANKRDEGFSIFYMAINLGSMFAAAAALGIMGYVQENYAVSKADSYHFAFAVACVSLIFSIAIYYMFRGTFAHADRAKVVAKGATEVVEEKLTPAQTKERIVCLCLVFAVVIFFWMAFHQNGTTMTQFAEVYTQKSDSGVSSLMFNVFNLVLCILMVYGALNIFQSKNVKGKVIAAAMFLIPAAILVEKAINVTGSVVVDAPIFQQFNPCFVVALTPVVMLVFSWLAKKGKEPSSPMKIGLGMLVAGLGFVVLMFASNGLPTPAEQSVALENGTATLVSPNWLISTYFVLTVAELLLSPIGISFVSKVAPPQYKGMMMGLWFVATAIGNFLVAIPGLLWGELSLYVVWGVCVGVCLVSAIFIFSILKRLEKVAK
ncbi:MAG: peptide MFS transporter [Bacteroidales bacterium]|nr:peptide MFS transporter [Bacteroidales bacterium]MBR2606475.1 peptide MFS transporter [Bacteroidaceae bacterium]